MNITVFPKKLSGQVTVPPSKSVAHRMVIAAALSNGVSEITNLYPSVDILATMDCMRALGAKIDFDGDKAVIEGWAGMIANRSTGSLVSFETGEAVTYGLFNAQQRGTLLVGAGEKVYEGMVIGYTASGEDVDVNVCKTKHLTNTRASGSDDALRLIPISKLSLEGCLEFLAQDELLEVTPENLRIRKQILNHEQRMKAKSKLK